MIRQLIACAKYPGNPLFRLCSEMKWGIQFAQYEIDELEKYVSIAQWESARPNLDLPKIEARTEVSA